MKIFRLIHLLRKKRLLLPVMVLALELAAFAQKKVKDKELITGHLQAAELNETSGIAASQKHAGVYYIHNDSGDTSRFFAIDPAGQLKGTYYYTNTAHTVHAYDCEDIAVGPGPVAGKSYVYVADIGDNAAVRPLISIYRTPEPGLPPQNGKEDVQVSVLHLKYPDKPRDAETMMIDPIEKLIYVISKRESEVTVYTAPLSYQDGDTVTLTSRCKLRFKGFGPFKWIVAGDISHDGSQVLVKSYSHVFYWKRQGHEPVWQTLQREPQELPYEQEQQGEAIGFAPDGRSYYTVSEGKQAPIYHYTIPAN